MLGLERGGHLHADPAPSLRHDRVSEAGHEDPFVQEPSADLDRERRLADDDGDDRRLAFEQAEAELREPARKPGVLAATGRRGRVGAQGADRGQRAAGDRSGSAFEKSWGRER